MIEVYIRNMNSAWAARKWCQENIGSTKNIDTGQILWFYSIIDVRRFRIRDAEIALAFKLIWG